MIIKKTDKNFYSIFNTETGFYVRSGVFVDGKETETDPFMASFPELLDIGIMGSCVHGKTGLCLKAGIECYQDGLNIQNKNMSLEDYESIMKQCEGRLFQVAEGGRGDPDMHENFEEILKITRKYNIVPNFTTSGLGMTPEKAEICKRYCGAVAVSWYRSDYTYKAIDMLLKAKVKTNIHYVLANNTIDEAIKRLENNDFPKGINAIVFLLHKPVGLGTEKNVLYINDPKLKRFFELVENPHPFKIGFDSCSCPAIVNLTNTINLNTIDYCEGGRYSAYIDADMNMMPCSFANQDPSWFVSLKEHTVEEAWNSEVFEKFRNSLKNSCSKCKDKEHCAGGCPLLRSIVLCNREEKDCR